MWEGKAKAKWGWERGKTISVCWIKQDCRTAEAGNVKTKTKNLPKRKDIPQYSGEADLYYARIPTSSKNHGARLGLMAEVDHLWAGICLCPSVCDE